LLRFGAEIVRQQLEYEQLELFRRRRLHEHLQQQKNHGDDRCLQQQQAANISRPSVPPPSVPEISSGKRFGLPVSHQPSSAQPPVPHPDEGRASELPTNRLCLPQPNQQNTQSNYIPGYGRGWLVYLPDPAIPDNIVDPSDDVSHRSNIYVNIFLVIIVLVLVFRSPPGFLCL
jgi:hypothetical protein